MKPCSMAKILRCGRSNPLPYHANIVSITATQYGVSPTMRADIESAPTEKNNVSITAMKHYTKPLLCERKSLTKCGTIAVF